MQFREQAAGADIYQDRLAFELPADDGRFGLGKMKTLMLPQCPWIASQVDLGDESTGFV